jgi:putative ABC transport system permease protein
MRYRLRTAILLAAIAFGVAGLILSGGFVRDMFIQLGEAVIHSQSGHLQLAPAGYFTSGSRSPEKFRIVDPDVQKREIAALPGVADVLARLHFSGLLSNGSTTWPILGEGVEPEKESRLGTHVQISSGRALTSKDSFGIMLGQGVARVLKLRPGDPATLLVSTAEGALNTLDFEVVGIFQTFSSDFDNHAVRIALPAAQELLGTKGANVLVVTLHDTDRTGTMLATLQHQYEKAPFDIRTWMQLSDFYEKTVLLYKQQFGILQLIILAMVILSVANVVNMSVFERMGEFGTMMALGNRGRFLVRLILTESALLGLGGGALGVLLGVSIALAISAVGIPMPPPPNAHLGYLAFIRVVPEIVAMAFIVGLVAPVIAAVHPAFRISRTPIANALRANI